MCGKGWMFDGKGGNLQMKRSKNKVLIGNRTMEGGELVKAREEKRRTWGENGGNGGRRCGNKAALGW